MASRGRDPWAGAAAIVARISQAEAAREMAGALEQRMLAFDQLSESSRADVVSGLQRTVGRWSRFAATGVMPPDGAFDPLREWTRARRGGRSPGGPAALVRVGASAGMGAAAPPRAGLLGRLNVEDHLLEILLDRSPRLIARLRGKVLPGLAADDRGELEHTLRTLIGARLDRTATSATLHIHRNTLAYRLKRIEQFTGLDLGSPATSRACSWRSPRT